jgi:hypothetical protein
MLRRSPPSMRFVCLYFCMDCNKILCSDFYRTFTRHYSSLLTSMRYDNILQIEMLIEGEFITVMAFD